MSRKWMVAFPILTFFVFLLAACAPVEFSPDGQRLLFCWSGDGRWTSLFTMNTDGSQLKALPGAEEGWLGRWSPDSKTILFGDAQQRLKAYDTQTNKVVQAWPDASLAFAWKEDSQQFAALYVPANGIPELRRQRWPEGTVMARTPLPPRVSTVSFSQMTWLRGRDEVAFLGIDANSHSHVYLVSEAGLREPLHSTDALGLGQSADGKYLLWACPGANLTQNLLTLYQYEATTGRVTRLPFPAHLASINADASHVPQTIESVTFSPDGRCMALVVSQQTGQGNGTDPVEGKECVYVARIDGTDAHLVQQVSAGVHGSHLDIMEELLPSWSHDGKRLAVLRWGHSQTTISLYDANGSGRVVLLLPAHSDFALAQRVRTYVSRHYSGLIPRSHMDRQPEERH